MPRPEASVSEFAKIYPKAEVPVSSGEPSYCAATRHATRVVYSL